MMPIYEYECLECGLHFDKLQRFGEPGPETCPRGHERIHRLLSQPAIIFKGSGFYVTDNRRNGSGSTSHKSLRDRSLSDTAASDTAAHEGGSSRQAEDKESGSAFPPKGGETTS
jgi:putative FmdB family regulatory protein